MRVDTSNGTSIPGSPSVNDKWGAMYLAVSLLNTEEDIPLFWVEAPDGVRVGDPKAISDFAD
jgi:hypothetical protein